MSFYTHTYLKANGYLEKFRNALNMPSLSLPLLNALLKTFNKEKHLNGFIVPGVNGGIMYNKIVLNKILGIDESGHQFMAYDRNPNLNTLKNYIDEWDRKEVEASMPKPKMEWPKDDEPAGTDMNKVSNGLLSQDNYGYGRVDENTKNLQEGKKVKKIHLTESQFKEFVNEQMNKIYFVDVEKVNPVCDFLDKTFAKASMTGIKDDGEPGTMDIVVIKGADNSAMRKMTAKQAFLLLQSHFKDIYEDKEQRDKFLKLILKDWYYNKIKNGLPSKNRY